MSIAWIFPGQGSQSVGMGHDLMDLGAEQMQQAEAILGWSLLDLTETELAQTTYAQPALFLVSAILTDILLARGHYPVCVAGHSLGEYSALYAAGVLDFSTTLNLVHQRAALMAQGSPGGMTAVIGFDRAHLEELCAATPGVTLANDNSPDQVVITGDSAAMAAVVAALKPKRAVPLAVSGAFHSPFMATAAQAFSQLLDPLPFAPARIPIYSNATAAPTQDPQQIKHNLKQQMTAGVRWRETVLAMAAAGVTTTWEVGSGTVLTNLVKRTVPSLERLSIQGAKSLPD
jgi:[acyl-carrier-protein] S-malonyltransferase